MESTKIKLLGSGPPKLPEQDNVRTRAFATFAALEKSLEGCKTYSRGPYVVQVCF